jgi:hypothetical protein
MSYFVEQYHNLKGFGLLEEDIAYVYLASDKRIYIGCPRISFEAVSRL